MWKNILDAIWAADNIMEIHKVYVRVYGEGDELWQMVGEGWGWGWPQAHDRLFLQWVQSLVRVFGSKMPGRAEV